MKDKDYNVKQMFSSIAQSYDLLNRLLSVGIDISWRRRAVDLLSLKNGTYLDIATGTCDVLLEILKRGKGGISVLGIDFSLPMLKIGARKLLKNDFSNNAGLEYGDAQKLPYRDNSFDGTIIAFGLRNVSDREEALKEMRRVVKRAGRVVILEFTMPENRLIKIFYSFYFTRILPFLGGIISGKRSAYEYLPSSVLAFPSPEQLKVMMETAGLESVVYENLTFGIASIHVGIKK